MSLMYVVRLQSCSEGLHNKLWKRVPCTIGVLYAFRCILCYFAYWFNLHVHLFQIYIYRYISNHTSTNPLIYRGAEKYLVRPGGKQATATKL